MKKVNCFRCAHFHTTWNPSFPRGCKAYGFKTKELPSVYVFKVTGTPCMQFEPSDKQTSTQGLSTSYFYDRKG
ncbi:hypothetical protein ACFFGV_16445 [Pontibacillus salicampi]|uniref:Uracil-DNA glycosylase n=1 Tax=Pontibacillus salicampi TaxID=1449801 RepID=A0ABV6LS09_9BACI